MRDTTRSAVLLTVEDIRFMSDWNTHDKLSEGKMNNSKYRTGMYREQRSTYIHMCENIKNITQLCDRRFHEELVFGSWV